MDDGLVVPVEESGTEVLQARVSAPDEGPASQPHLGEQGLRASGRPEAAARGRDALHRQESPPKATRERSVRERDLEQIFERMDWPWLSHEMQDARFLYAEARRCEIYAEWAATRAAHRLDDHVKQRDNDRQEADKLDIGGEVVRLWLGGSGQRFHIVSSESGKSGALVGRRKFADFAEKRVEVLLEVDLGIRVDTVLGLKLLEFSYRLDNRQAENAILTLGAQVRKCCVASLLNEVSGDKEPARSCGRSRRIRVFLDEERHVLLILRLGRGRGGCCPGAMDAAYGQRLKEVGQGVCRFEPDFLSRLTMRGAYFQQFSASQLHGSARSRLETARTTNPESSSRRFDAISGSVGGSGRFAGPRGATLGVCGVEAPALGALAALETGGGFIRQDRCAPEGGAARGRSAVLYVDEQVLESPRELVAQQSDEQREVVGQTTARAFSES